MDLDLGLTVGYAQDVVRGDVVRLVVLLWLEESPNVYGEPAEPGYGLTPVTFIPTVLQNIEWDPTKTQLNLSNGLVFIVNKTQPVLVAQ